MESDEIGRLLYLSLLGVAIAGYFFVGNRQEISKSLRQFALWALIFVGVIAGYGLWNDVSNEIMPRQSFAQDDRQISVPQSPDGHYYLTLKINDANVRFVVDTGATEMVLNIDDARRAGIDVDNLAYLGRANTANGVVRTASVRLETVELGSVLDRNFPASVNGGQMDGSLLGMTYLSRFDTLEIKERELVLTR